MFNKTVKELLLKNKNAAPGFDALRLILATAIVFWHSFYVCYPEKSETFFRSWTNPIWHPFLKMILPMFFFLSGFLVASSAFRVRSIFIFFSNRFLRIIPALLVELFLSAFFLGAAVTTVPLSKYYGSKFFFKYFLNLIGIVQYYLPGVFLDHPCAMVNANLWTLPSEFHCYAIMMALMATGIIFNRKLFLIFFGIMSVVVVRLLFTKWTWGEAGVVFVRPPLLVCSFFIGTFCFIYADRIVIKKSFIVLSVLGLYLFDLKIFTFLGLIFSCYLCLCIGFVNLKNFPLIQHGDYSYGIYLYSFPIQQTVWHFIPLAHTWWVLFLIAYPIVLVFSVFSWRVIEKPFLSLKSKL